MNIFNVCRGYTTRINDMVIPKGAIYGKDSIGYYAIFAQQNKTLRDCFIAGFEDARFETYRYYAGEWWIIGVEKSPTMQYVYDCIEKFNLWDSVFEYPKYTGMHLVSTGAVGSDRHGVTNSKSYNSVTPKSTGKQLQELHEKRHDHEFIRLNSWEKVAPMIYGERNGSIHKDGKIE